MYELVHVLAWGRYDTCARLHLLLRSVQFRELPLELADLWEMVL